MEFLLIFGAFLVFSILVGKFATTRNRSAGNWFVISVLISPLLAFLVLLFLRKLKSAAEVEEELTTKACPYCAERIKAQAIVCKYCGRDLPREPEPDLRDADARFERWLAEQDPPVVNPTPGTRAELRRAFDYLERERVGTANLA